MLGKDLSGHLVLLMAPSGSGKSVLIKHLRENLSGVVFSVSCTTRSPRYGEKNGEVYYFLSRTEFEKKIENNEFLEWAEYSGNLYGTLNSEVVSPMQSGEIVLREVDLQGVHSILSKIKRSKITVIYIDGGAWETLSKRIKSRSKISEEELELRKQRYLLESKAKELADFVVINEEGRLNESKSELIAILQDVINRNKNNA